MVAIVGVEEYERLVDMSSHDSQAERLVQLRKQGEIKELPCPVDHTDLYEN
jgi:hypothetical protein